MMFNKVFLTFILNFLLSECQKRTLIRICLELCDESKECAFNGSRRNQTESCCHHHDKVMNMFCFNISRSLVNTKFGDQERRQGPHHLSQIKQPSNIQPSQSQPPSRFQQQSQTRQTPNIQQLSQSKQPSTFQQLPQSEQTPKIQQSSLSKQQLTFQQQSQSRKTHEIQQPSQSKQQLPFQQTPQSRQTPKIQQPSQSKQPSTFQQPPQSRQTPKIQQPSQSKQPSTFQQPPQSRQTPKIQQPPQSRQTQKIQQHPTAEQKSKKQHVSDKKASGKKTTSTKIIVAQESYVYIITLPAKTITTLMNIKDPTKWFLIDYNLDILYWISPIQNRKDKCLFSNRVEIPQCILVKGPPFTSLRVDTKMKIFFVQVKDKQNLVKYTFKNPRKIKGKRIRENLVYTFHLDTLQRIIFIYSSIKGTLKASNYDGKISHTISKGLYSDFITFSKEGEFLYGLNDGSIVSKPMNSSKTSLVAKVNDCLNAWKIGENILLSILGKKGLWILENNEPTRIFPDKITDYYFGIFPMN